MSQRRTGRVLSWDAAVQLTASPAGYWTRYPSVICDSRGDYCIAWYTYPPPDTGKPAQVYFSRAAARLDAVATAPVVQVTDDGRNHSGASLIQDGAGAYWLAWHIWPQRNGPTFIGLSRSDDGKRWSPPSLPLESVAEVMIYPDLVWDRRGRYWLTFTADRGPTSRLYLTCSSDGQQWAHPFRLAVSEPGDNRSNLATSPSGHLWMVWRSNRQGVCGLWWSRSSDGDVWNPPRPVAPGSWEPDRPKLAFDREGLAWVCFESDGAIWCSFCEDERNWSTPTRISDARDFNTRPSAVVQSQAGDYWVAWTSQRVGIEIWTARGS